MGGTCRAIWSGVPSARIVGAAISFFFMRLDVRNEELVAVGKTAIQAVERVLFQVPKGSQPQAAATVMPPSWVSRRKPVPRQSGQLGSMGKPQFR